MPAPRARPCDLVHRTPDFLALCRHDISESEDQVLDGQVPLLLKWRTDLVQVETIKDKIQALAYGQDGIGR